MTFKTNPHILDDSVNQVNSPVVSLNLYESDGSDILLQNLSEPFTINIDTPGIASTDVKIVQHSLDWKQNMTFHSWNRTSSLSDTDVDGPVEAEALSIAVAVSSLDVEAIDVFIRKDTFPSETDFDYYQSIELTNATEDGQILSDNKFELFLNDSFMQMLGSGTFFVGFKEQGR